MLTTTFRLLRELNACKKGYTKLVRGLGGVNAYGKDTPIPLWRILETNNLADTLWSLRAVPVEQRTERDRIARLFGCDCAEHVLPIYEAKYPGDLRPRQAIEAARRYADGLVTAAEMEAAWVSAWAAEEAAVSAVSAADAVSAAWAAAGAAVSAAEEAAVSAEAAADAAGAAWAAAEAAWVSARAAEEAAWAGEREWQTARLREMLSGDAGVIADEI